MANDSENLERAMKLLTDDGVWVMEPGGMQYHGAEEIKGFVGIALAGRTHDKDHKVEILIGLPMGRPARVQTFIVADTQTPLTCTCFYDTM